MNCMILISGDINDGDYLDKFTPIDRCEANALRGIGEKFWRGSPILIDDVAALLTEDEIDTLYNYIPLYTVTGEYIYEITFYQIVEYAVL